MPPPTEELKKRKTAVAAASAAGSEPHRLFERYRGGAAKWVPLADEIAEEDKYLPSEYNRIPYDATIALLAFLLAYLLDRVKITPDTFAYFDCYRQDVAGILQLAVATTERFGIYMNRCQVTHGIVMILVGLLVANPLNLAVGGERVFDGAASKQSRRRVGRQTTAVLNTQIFVEWVKATVACVLAGNTIVYLTYVGLTSGSLKGRAEQERDDSQPVGQYRRVCAHGVRDARPQVASTCTS